MSNFKNISKFKIGFDCKNSVSSEYLNSDEIVPNIIGYELNTNEKKFVLIFKPSSENLNFIILHTITIYRVNLKLLTLEPNYIHSIVMEFVLKMKRKGFSVSNIKDVDNSDNTVLKVFFDLYEEPWMMN